MISLLITIVSLSACTASAVTDSLLIDRREQFGVQLFAPIKLGGQLDIIISVRPDQQGPCRCSTCVDFRQQA